MKYFFSRNLQGIKTLADGSCNDKQDAEVVTPTVKKIKQHSTVSNYNPNDSSMYLISIY